MSALERTVVSRLTITNRMTMGIRRPARVAAISMLFLLGNEGNGLPWGMSRIWVGTGV